VAILAAAYTFLAPAANERFGWNLPELNDRQQGPAVAQADTAVSADASVSADTARRRSPTATPEAGVDGDPNLKFGLLRDLGGERYLSPAGLQYTRGSAEGHRLKHVERHTADQPSRPGKHGVFDGGMPGALETIDRAYERAKNKQRTTVKQDRDRTIYTVDMGSRVGFVGGQSGRRQRNPMARRVQLVLEDNRVITAYPTN